MTQLENIRESEKKVLQLFVQNFTIAEIAQTLKLSTHTVKSHLSRLERLGALKKEGNYQHNTDIISLFENLNKIGIAKLDEYTQNTVV